MSQARFDLKARVIENICLGGKYYRMRIEGPEIARIAEPGQFCMIRPEFSGDSLLRRPFSIAAVRGGRILEFAYTAIGRGTKLLARQKPDDVVLCFGPLGNSFPIVQQSKAIVVAGGIGVAPFPFLNDILNQHQVFPITCYGARNVEELIYVEELNRLSERLVLATDDGSSGFHGFVTDILASEIQNYRHEAVVYACGPHPMLARVKAIAAEVGVAAYLSMEEVMGCGVGLCIGCPIPAATEESPFYYLCCKDGPIFPSSTVRL
jgi:dihydroorotate dehydrogenase electron transfer subunit